MDSAEFVQITAAHVGMGLFELLKLAENADAREYVLDQLKAQADVHWGKDARVSLLIAQSIIAIGELIEDSSYIAMGKMAAGDALRFLNRIREAHETLEEAGNIFKKNGDEIGWARTRIGRLLTSEAIDGQTLKSALEDVDRARRIFVKQQRFDLLLRLLINVNAFHIRRSEYSAAKKVLQLGLELMNSGQSSDTYRAKLLHNLGIVEQLEGQYHQAASYFQQAQDIFEKIDQPADAYLVQSSSAQLLMHQGDYRRALALLQSLDDKLGRQEQIINRINTIVCYQQLGAPERASRVAENLAKMESLHPMHLASGHMFWAECLQDLGNYDGAVNALNLAESIFQSLNADETVNDVRVRRACVYLMMREEGRAVVDAEAALSSEDIHTKISAQIVLARAALHQARLEEATAHAIYAYRHAQFGMEFQRFSARILLGDIREARGEHLKAARHYRAAHERVLQLQRDLTIDFRSNFLTSNQAALHGTIRSAIHQNDAIGALTTLEQMKSLVVMQYIENRHLNRISSDAADSPYLQQLVDDLHTARDRLRGLMHTETDALLDTGQRREMRDLETEISDLRVAIRIHKQTETRYVDILDLELVLTALPDQTGVIEYYSDGAGVYVFSYSKHCPVNITLLPVDYHTLTNLILQTRRSMGRALAVGAQAAGSALVHETQAVLGQLHKCLLAPINDFTRTHVNLIVVPFGILHSVPFHLLYDDNDYLIEHTPVSIQPASGMIARSTPVHSRHGVLALGFGGAESGGRMEQEAQHVVELLGGSAHVGAEAISDQLLQSDAAVLHLAAHGKYHLSQPRLSHLQLADGRLYVDDLWQYDLDYELVTLSACSVGLGHASGGDELSGFGHSFLYAGAASLVSSLWEVDDEAAAVVNHSFYSRCLDGEAKVDALRNAQLEVLKDNHFRHPAYWGAFQLIGETSPFNLFST